MLSPAAGHGLPSPPHSPVGDARFRRFLVELEALTPPAREPDADPVQQPVQEVAPLRRAVQEPAPGEQNPLQNPHMQGPIGPKTRHQRYTIMNLEYSDYNPNDPPPEFAGLPRRLPNIALYISFLREFRWSPHMICAAMQGEIGEGELHHLQGFYTDTRKRPSLAQQYVVFSDSRGVPLRPWQYRAFPCDNPRGAWEYAIKGPEYRDAQGRPDTGRPMPGAPPRTHGLPPPPGPIQRGGPRNENGGGRGGAVAEGNADMVRIAQYVRDHARNKRKLRELYLDPDVIGHLKPTEALILNIHRAFNEPDLTPNLRFKRRVVILVGASGCGKTTAARMWCHANGVELWDAQTPKDGYYGGFMQGYTGQRAALFDECTGNFVNFETFLKLTHSHEGSFDQKHGECIWRPEIIFITSMTHPRHWTWHIGGSTVRRQLRAYDTEKKPFYRRLDYGGIFIWESDDDHVLVQPMLPRVADLSPEPNRYYEVIQRPAAFDRQYGTLCKGELTLARTEGTERLHVQDLVYRKGDRAAMVAARQLYIAKATRAAADRAAEELRIVAMEEATRQEAEDLAREMARVLPEQQPEQQPPQPPQQPPPPSRLATEPASSSPDEDDVAILRAWSQQAAGEASEGSLDRLATLVRSSGEDAESEQEVQDPRGRYQLVQLLRRMDADEATGLDPYLQQARQQPRPPEEDVDFTLLVEQHEQRAMEDDIEANQRQRRRPRVLLDDEAQEGDE